MTSRIRVAALALPCVLATLLPSQTAENVSTMLLARAKSAINQAARLAAADDGRLWGTSLAGPLLLVDPTWRMAVANQADAEGKLRESDGVWTGFVPNSVPLANTATSWAGVRWTMVLASSLPATAYDRGRLLMHESFHRVQPALGLPAASPANAHLDTESGRVWLRLEMRALAEALSRAGEERKACANAALAFRAARVAVAGADAAKEEAALEANEGLAEYTGLVLCGLPRTALEPRAAIELERKDAAASLTRSFAYATGPALALLLDEYAKDWRKSIEKQQGLAALLANAIAVKTTGDAILTARTLASGYDGEFVFAEEGERARKHAARLAQLQHEFVDGRVLRIVTSSALNYSFDPNAAEPLDSSRIVYTPLTVSDAWGTLEAPTGAMLVFASPMALIVPIPDGATAESVPWKLTLKPGYTLEAPREGAWRIVAATR